MNKNIKQFILFAAGFLILVYALQYGIDYCFKKRVTHKFTKIFNHQTDPEVMVFGSSIAYHQFDPAIIKSVTGLSAYNMGWDGLFFVQYDALISEYLAYERNCRYIVIACDFDNLGKNELITRPDLFYAYLGNKYVYNALHEIEPEKIARARWLPGYKFTLLNKSFYSDILFAGKSPQDALSGYDPDSSKNKWDATDTLKPFTARFDPRIYDRLGQVIHAITDKGIKVIIVMTPVYKEGYQLILNADTIKNKYSALAGKDVYFFDYTHDSLCSSKGYFHNYSHLNLEGVTIFSHTFSNDLLKIKNDNP